MRLILLGAPGAGKGTQAVMLSQRLNVPHISTGDIFRNNIKSGTKLGLKAKEYMEKGGLVPDEITIAIVKDRIGQPDCARGFIFDGFPRTIPQAEYLDRVLDEMGLLIDHVIDIYVTDQKIIERLSGRRVCPSCGAIYHLKSNPPEEADVCNSCKTGLIQREDDKEETVIKRLDTYHKQTEPLIEYYRNKGKLITVTGQETIEETTKGVQKALGI